MSGPGEKGLLGVPLGGAGSGRARYGRAMALYAEGRIAPATLEAYRVAAASDREAPARVLAEFGLEPPETWPASAEMLIRSLLAEADRYLARLPGPGVPEARQGIARFAAGPVLPQGRQEPAVVARHLDAALAATQGAGAEVAAAIQAARPVLRWVTYDAYPRAEIGESFATGHAFASILGEEGLVRAQDFDLGLFLIAPHVLYRDHCHAAPELYAPLTGPHGWRFGSDKPLMIKPAHQPVWNPPFRPHLTKVGPDPFLCLFIWTRDVNEPARVLPAADWPALEALRLG